ncbi:MULTISPECIES: iron-siderophore ABC transporter substrate-binding protein [unclassified Paenibacillus]|uniref:ABC transporter substrate-binding protein n=1 Tax=unclassified Paenibacillus TaxID=185978 RepID=UPI0024050B4F|nr:MULTISPECIES: iron-siderophore ABC transporter substrate-binding protein [unclassified Paenibacillus]MDF9841485.1 iron complex transport system substrate-binding protein [Paenibacillus sp. PastF-2]MDF9848074.1 iron complex transport system substrate-binding protein [Paenibacillus sp. PastM-2]MDF9854643.1 iron complex transport system substrate-binding protein [Paenibacillus sp. PastF-1]MDH6479749.1 iron complex transport system substrate-binding protein [Paenibacillus sp. PastH-2]MDH6507349
MNRATKKQSSSLLMVWMLALVLVLTACGTNGGNANTGNAAQATAAASAEPSPASETQASPTPETQTAAAFPVTIKHMKGEYKLNEKPKVIAALDVKFVDQLVALGEQPAGSVVAGAKGATFPDYLMDQLSDVQVLGTRDEPNLEAIVALKPDLILMTDFQEEAYESVSKIAPTIVLDFYEDWRDTLATIGKITGKQAEAVAVQQAYEDKIVGLREQLAAKLGDDTVALIRPRPEGIRVHGPEHRTGSILYEDLGLNAPEFVKAITEDTSVEISMETVADIGADRYFLLSDDLFAKDAAELANSPVWKSMDAVKNNRAYDVNATLWIAYYGPIAINIIVDQAAEALLGAQ